MTEQDEWLTVEEIAERLKIHPQTVRRWIKRGLLPAIKLEDKVGYRVKSQDLTNYLEQKSVAGPTAHPRSPD